MLTSFICLPCGSEGIPDVRDQTLFTSVPAGLAPQVWLVGAEGYLWMNALTKNVTCHFNKQRILRPSNHQPLSWPLMMHHKGNSRCRGVGGQVATSLCGPPPVVYPEGLQEREKQNTGPRLLPINSLTWDVWFSLISSNLSMSWLPGFFCLLFVLQKEKPIFLTPPYLFGRISQNYLKLELKSSVSLLNKTEFSLFKLCLFFQLMNDWFPGKLLDNQTYLQSSCITKLICGDTA